MKNIFSEVDRLQAEINQHRPLSAHLKQQIKEYYRIGLTYSSNALEGNTLTESETKIVLEEGITIGGKPLRDHLEAQGLSDAYDFMYDIIASQTITIEQIKQLHRLFYYRIAEQQAGVYRTAQVLITGSKYPTTSPDKINTAMIEMVTRLNNLRSKLHPVEFAAQLHKEFVFIHPFIDGNGRVARLLLNLVLLQAGYNIVIIPPIMRVKYISSLEKAHLDDRDFVVFIAQMLQETQKDYLRLL
jgi:Fic family protein